MVQLNSAYALLLAMDEWSEEDEQKHPRESNGRFTSGARGTKAKKTPQKQKKSKKKPQEANQKKGNEKKDSTRWGNWATKKNLKRAAVLATVLAGLYPYAKQAMTPSINMAYEDPNRPQMTGPSVQVEARKSVAATKEMARQTLREIGEKHGYRSDEYQRAQEQMAELQQNLTDYLSQYDGAMFKAEYMQRYGTDLFENYAIDLSQSAASMKAAGENLVKMMNINGDRERFGVGETEYGNEVLFRDLRTPIVKGSPRTTEQAMKETNPTYSKDKNGLDMVNCQTCVVAYKMLKDGYNVQADILKYNGANGYAMWDPIGQFMDPNTGERPKPITVKTSSQGYSDTMRNLENTVKQGESYCWVIPGHITIVERDSSGRLVNVEPQNNSKHYLTTTYLNHFYGMDAQDAESYVFRVDNAVVSTSGLRSVIPQSGK